MNGGFTAHWDNGFGAGIRFRYVDDRPANEDGSLIARGYFLMDLVGTYRWRNLELGVTIFNATNTDWREAQFADTPCTRNMIQGTNPNAPCFSKPGKNAIDPAAQITFTPGAPIGVLAGLTFFF
jgi:outer membrane receptor protein involved in Fe transport